MKEQDSAIALADLLTSLHESGQADSGMPPLVRTCENGEPQAVIQEGDAVVFCCRRGERETELTRMFTDPGFDTVERKWIQNLKFVTLTQYHESLKYVPAAFPPQTQQGTLAECLSKAGKTQYHCSESEKIAHVTFFLNGGINHPFPGEADETFPSLKEHQEEHPELRSAQITDKVLNAVGKYDFIVVNYANGDVIGHRTGEEAKIRTAEAVSEQLNRLIPEAVKQDYFVLITADHGNLESGKHTDGTPDTSHTTNPVPLIVVGKDCPSEMGIADGSLSDVAPTVLEIMGVPKSASMTGKNLISGCSFRKDQKVLLVILDGWGIGLPDSSNPIYVADTPYWDSLQRYPQAHLQASGSFVGLAEGKTGNSEAGHLNIGAGRVVIQDDIRIDKAIEDGSFFENEVLLSAVRYVKESKGALHLIGLLSESSSHGSVNYLLAMCRMAADLPRVYLHVVIDGSSPEVCRSQDQLRALSRKLKEIGNGQVISCVGRKYAMDRDQDYSRVKVAYDAYVSGKGMAF